MVFLPSVFVGLGLSIVLSSASFSSLPTFNIPMFDYVAVQQGDEPTRLLQALQTDGIIALKNIPNYANLRDRYLLKAAECAAVTGDQSFVTRKLFDDNTKRFTISTNAGRDLMGSASATDVLCPGYRQLYEEFSQTVEHAVNTFGNTLDKSSFTISDGYKTIPSRQLIRDAVRLDHFHAYEAAPSSASDSSARNLALSLPLHEDHGLFIAMATPKLFEMEQGESRRLVERELAADASGLVIQRSTGDHVRPVLHGDELVLMMGTGATRWLETSHPIPAVLHGMKMPSVSAVDGTRRLRAWFGKMTLLPAYQRMLLGEGALFEDHLNATLQHLVNAEQSDLKTVGCASGRRLQESAKCTHRQCKPKEGATPSQPCNTLCNRQGHSPADGEECTKSCDCVTGGSGDMCWMLCVANLPVNECPLVKQKCDESTQVMQCLAPSPLPVPPPTTPSRKPSSAPANNPKSPVTLNPPPAKDPTSQATSSPPPANNPISPTTLSPPPPNSPTSPSTFSAPHTNNETSTATLSPPPANNETSTFTLSPSPENNQSSTATLILPPPNNQSTLATLSPPPDKNISTSTFSASSLVVMITAFLVFLI